MKSMYWHGLPPVCEFVVTDPLWNKRKKWPLTLRQRTLNKVWQKRFVALANEAIEEMFRKPLWLAQPRRDPMEVFGTPMKIPVQYEVK